MTLFYPKVTWSGDNHTLNFGTPIDMAEGTVYVEKVEVRTPGGQQDSWVHGEFQRLKMKARWVPASGTAANAGWHFPGPGFRAWMQHVAHNKDNFTYYPDKDSAGAHTCRMIAEPRWGRESASPVQYWIEMEFEDVSGKSFDEY